MKKRVLLSLIITGIAIIVSNKLWLNNKVDFLLLEIILMISFLLMYKFFNYLAEFNDIQGKSRIEIVFLTLFFISLFIPMSYIDKRDYSKMENRLLAKFPQVFVNDKLNYNFGKDFENYFNDRFCLRNILLTLDLKRRNLFCFDVYIDKTAYWNKKNNWLFTENCWGTKVVWGQCDEYKTNDYKKALYQLQKFCDLNGIKLYIIAVPTREKALPQYQNFNVFDFRNIPEYFGSVAHNLIKETNTNLIYPIDELLNYNGSELLYYKTDHHYSISGAEFVYDILTKKIAEDGIKLKKHREDSYTYDKYPHGTWGDAAFKGSLYNKLKLSNDKIFDVTYKYYDMKNIERIKDDSICKIIYNNASAPNSQRVYIVGDSFVHYMAQVLSHDFQSVIERRDNLKKRTLMFSDYKEDILKNKTKILIFTYSSAHMDRFFYNILGVNNAI